MKSQKKAFTPDFHMEESCDGPVCGLDEAGRGPIAGPVVAACVYIPVPVKAMPFTTRLRDSKTLSPRIREALYAEIVGYCRYGVAVIESDEIDRINILQASLKAMSQSYTLMKQTCMLALVDGNQPPLLPCPVRTVVKGDALSVSISAASIVAKVTRDRIMQALHGDFPQYGWDRNAGYPAPAHKKALLTHGVTIHHRRSYAPVRAVLSQ